MHTKQTSLTTLCFFTGITNSPLYRWTSTDVDRLQTSDSILHKSCTNFTFIPSEWPELLLLENVIQIQIFNLSSNLEITESSYFLLDTGIVFCQYASYSFTY